MAYLKTGEWRGAEADCSLALALDDSYVKAYHRRGSARKNLKEYAKALEDWRHVLILDPNNVQAKSDIEEVSRIMIESKKETPATDTKENAAPVSGEQSKVKGMFVSKSPAASGSSSMVPGQIMPVEKPPHLRSKTPLQQIKITEIPSLALNPENEPVSLKEKKSSVTKPLIEVIDVKDHPVVTDDKEGEKNMVDKISKSTGFAGKVEKEIINAKSSLLKNQQPEKQKKTKKPSTSVQFANTWARLTSLEEKEEYIGLLSPVDYPKVFKHSMEPSVFSGILEVLSQMRLGDPSTHLLGISRVPRVSAMILFLDEKEQSLVQLLVNKVIQKSLLSPSELKEIKKCFC